MRGLSPAVPLIALTLSIVAAQTVEPGKTFPVSGVVVDAVTGTPVARALVQPNAREDQGVLTDGSGRFHFPNIAVGHLGLAARKPGYEAAVGLGVISAATGDIKIELKPLCVIQGRVVDSDGDAVPGARVEVYQRSIEEGRATLQRRGWNATDDRGKYRIAELRSGSYLVRVAGRDGRDSLPVSGAVEAFGSSGREAIAHQWYGGASAVESALPTTLNMGQEATADFAVVIRPLSRTLGTIQGLSQDPVTLRLLSDDGLVQAAQSAFRRDSGQFVISDVPPGTWTVEAEIKGTVPRRATQVVSVKSGEVSGIALNLLPPVEVTGTVRVISGQENYKQYRQVILRETGTAIGGGHSVDTEAGGTFRIQNV